MGGGGIIGQRAGYYRAGGGGATATLCFDIARVILACTSSSPACAAISNDSLAAARGSH